MTTVTYDLNHANADIVAVSKIRIAIDDVKANQGPRPDGSNFSDDELLYFYSTEGDHIGRATAHACEVLAIQWSKVQRTMFGSLVDPRHITRNYERQAAQLRAKHGYAEDTKGAFSIAVKR